MIWKEHGTNRRWHWVEGMLRQTWTWRKQKSKTRWLWETRRNIKNTVLRVMTQKASTSQKINVGGTDMSIAHKSSTMLYIHNMRTYKSNLGAAVLWQLTQLSLNRTHSPFSLAHYSQRINEEILQFRKWSGTFHFCRMLLSLTLTKTFKSGHFTQTVMRTVMVDDDFHSWKCIFCFLMTGDWF